MKGSTWNKWDLHIHSPMTWLANNFTNNDNVEAYVKKLGEQQLSLIGVTNYFYFRQNELETIRDEITRQGLDIKVLGNIELRLDQQNKEGEYINIHVLFSDKLSTSRINEVLARLRLKLTDGSGRILYCCEKDVLSSGLSVETIVIDYSQLLEHLNSTLEPYRDFFIAICPNGYGGYRPDANGRSRELATWIDRQGQIIFGNLRDREFFLKTDRYPGASSKPVFHCSDAHCLEDIGSKYTWVKALPTFEGLRQATLEPSSRIRLKESWIDQHLSKVHFSRIEVGGSIFDGQSIRFKKLNIPLSPYMVAIIGGRGTGKSLLLDAIRSHFIGSATRGSEERAVNVEQLTIELDKANGEKILFDSCTESYDYLHVSQGEIKTLCQQPGLISDEIKKMLRLPDEHIPESLRNELDQNLNNYKSFRDYYSYCDGYNQKVNTREYHSEIIRVAQEKIKTLTSEKNKALIEKFQINSTRIAEFTQAISSGELLLKDTEEVEKNLNTRIMQMNSIPTGVVLIPQIELKELKDHTTNYVSTIQGQLKLVNEDNTRIIGEFRSQGIEQDISGVLDKIRGYQSQIEQAKLKVEEIQSRITQAGEDVGKREKMMGAFVHQFLEQKNTIDTSFASLAEKEHFTTDQKELIREILTDIRIYGQPYFDLTVFYNGILERVNRSRFRTSSEQSSVEKLSVVFGVETINDFIALIEGKEIIELPEEPGKKITLETFFWRSDYFNSQGPFALLAFLYSPEQVSRYLTVRAEFEYKGKTVEKLSAGQRGTFYVCLKLATDTFGSPFVFDQPEDDLDNEFIMRQLVPLFRKIKEYRQVIIVTHNANLVVNCDAEQVIIASNTDEVITYRSGALEYGDYGQENSMRKAICDVLEGGQHAFEARELKYGIQ
ncbi:DNA repair protein [Providencia rettgeri]|uniref:TrlF family AAA-like ATPase n=1 Tax=Providencia TaxID=586 RepID=UPI0013746D25|nr:MULTISPECIES: DNA repair protein [Providencia]MBW3104899.1 DNA repair protein [Providencia rettgeri]BBU95924.1 DNA repair ATPase [Providencia rettgeri]